MLGICEHFRSVNHIQSANRVQKKMQIQVKRFALNIRMKGGGYDLSDFEILLVLDKLL